MGLERLNFRQNDHVGSKKNPNLIEIIHSLKILIEFAVLQHKNDDR